MVRQLGRDIGTGVVGLTIGLATGVGLKGKVMVAVEGGKDLGRESLRIGEPRQDEEMCEGGNDGGSSNLEIEEMELQFTLPPPENPGHYHHHHHHHHHQQHHHQHHYHGHPK